MTLILNEAPTASLTGFLAIRQGDGRELKEVGPFLSIGRDPTNQLCIKDDFVSARHARLERRDAGYILRDLRSRNGTFLNGSRILEAPLTDGDRIRFGDTEAVFTETQESKGPRELKSKNERWQTELSRIPSLARTDLPVLITGPSGAGKEVVTAAIHAHSSRHAQHLVCVNCSALSESLIESELFGHVRGSFTGATHDRVGAFESARRGTLFLDEIGDLPLALQPKLLRALENHEVRPVGSDRSIKTDVRVIAATHHDLREKVSQGRFREDLYFRLNVIRVQVPSLSSHIEDFEDLLYHFAKHFRVGFTHPAILELKHHAWPGNIRELRNVVARAKAYFGQVKIEPKHLPELLETPPAPMPSPTIDYSRPVLKEIEREMIRERLVANQGNQRRTALDLGMPKSTLHDRIRLYGIDVSRLLAARGIYS